MYTAQPQDNWVRQLLFCGVGVGFLAVVLWGGSLLLDKWNDDQKARLTTNNLQLVKDNRELRESNKKLTQTLADREQRLGAIKEAMEGYK